MPSSRNLIRASIKTELINKLPNSITVYNNRVHDVNKTVLPMVNILTPEETFVRQSNDLFTKYNLSLVIQIVDKHSDSETLNNNLDLISIDIIKYIIDYQNNPLRVNLFDITVDKLELSFIDEREKIYGSCIINFTISYLESDSKQSAIKLIDPETGLPIPVYDPFGFSKELLDKLTSINLEIHESEIDEDVKPIEGNVIYE